LLADLGAEVIKVERPGSGDDTRHWGPPWHGEGDRKVAAYFLSCNRGKKSAAIDFAQPDGAGLVRKLAEKADVVVENFKVGGLSKFGLDAAKLRAANPRLIYASITGFGQDGPYADRAGYDFIIQGMGGMMSVTGLPDGEPGGGPMRAGVAIADLFTGMYACAAILASLYAREKTGEGATIDMALFDTQLAVMANQASNTLISGKDPPRQGNTHPNIVPYQPFEAADQPIIIAVGNDRQFARLADICGHPEWVGDERFATRQGWVDHLESDIRPAVEAWAASLTTVEASEAMGTAGVASGPCYSDEQIVHDPHIAARDMLVEVPRTDGVEQPILVPGNPIKMSGVADGPDTRFPWLGEHTDEVLRTELGLDADELAKLRADGVIA